MSILFCCMGNICRSPMAAALFQWMAEDAGYADRLLIDSAGTHCNFPDAEPDPRAQKVMAERGIDISAQRARRVTQTDFERFDLILVMDAQNFDALRFVAPKAQAHKIKHLLEYAPRLKKKDVPDPFQADEQAFRIALDMIAEGAKGLLEQLRPSFG